MSLHCLTIIPARIGSTRLPGKPLIDIAGYPMVVHVARRAALAKLGRVLVATDNVDIKATVEAHGFEAIMTKSKHKTGSDRIAEALIKIDPDHKYDTVINMQGDLPIINIGDIIRTVQILDNDFVDITTLCARIHCNEEKHNPNVVKVIGTPLGKKRLRALYFTRAKAPQGPGPLYHHIGVYVYRRQALERFFSLTPSPLEKREKLEQLRALENGMRIDVAIVKSIPLSINTAQDLERARMILKK
ncbi:MAG: 3-deoxy-manno-octulosonate cytidylyltransferase (CMP-KDO synthetase) [Candidatus Tokpelaia sp. JSC085]|nr:MAG: 3-deoxy-manno-octulosonate cytidylyltransferase (CMP-KDO synthetase) [Candidatus Tokpelaia sp. JSC085]